MAEAGLAPGPNPPSYAPDEYMKRLGSLPLIHHPGETWMYHIGSDILGVLIARASGQTLENFCRERIGDYLAFCQMMLNKGRHGHERILSRPSVEFMTTDHLTPEQKAGARVFFGDNSG